MEKGSNWRWNVAELGLDPYLTRLAAPILVSPGAYVVNRWTGFAWWQAYATFLDGDRGYVVSFPQQPPPNHPHFPFGIAVGPD